MLSPWRAAFKMDDLRVLFPAKLFTFLLSVPGARLGARWRGWTRPR